MTIKKLIKNSFSTKDFFYFIGLLSIILLLVFRNDPEPVYNISPIKEIETRVEGKETEINTIQTRIGNEKEIIEALSVQFDELRLDLEKVKSQRDTLLIIQIQDTIIETLTIENAHLDNVVVDQDSVIVAQRYVIESKDTIIKIKDHEIKRVKKQRNISLFFNVLEAGILIFKK